MKNNRHDFRRSPLMLALQPLLAMVAVTSMAAGAQQASSVTDKSARNAPLEAPGFGAVLPAGTLNEGNSNLAGQRRYATRGPNVALVGEIKLEIEQAAYPADGRTSARLRIRVLDRMGQTLVQPVLITVEASVGELLSADVDSIEPGHQIRVENGVAEVTLQSPSQPGDALIRLTAGQTSVEGKLTFLPELRPLLAVGVIEGTFNLRKLSSGALVPARRNDGFDEELRGFSRSFSDGKSDVAGHAAFFLKGKVQGDYLLTMAYDSDKNSRERMFRDIQPDQFYPVYGDSSVRGFDAQSSQRFYVRIDNEKSYLLYGDISTQAGGEARSLGQYSRSMTGVQEHYETKSASINAYASRDTLKQVIDEFPARGISGPYNVSNANGFTNSERVEIVTRDRNQPAIILKSVLLTRFSDYEFEPFSGRILFKSPISSLDANFNPVSIRVTYEVDQGGEKFWLGAVDGQVKLGDALEIGGSLVEDRNPLAPYKLYSFNATAKLTQHTFVFAEIARSDTQAVGQAIAQSAAPGSTQQLGKGDGKRIEIRHSDGDLSARLYAGKTDAAFNNPAATLNGGRAEAGAKVQYKIDDKTRLSAELLRSEDAATHGKREGARVSVERDLTDNIRFEVGVRRAKESSVPASATSADIGPLNNPAIGSPSSISLSAPPGTPGAGATPVDNTTVRARITGKIPSVNGSVYGEYEQDVQSATRKAAAIGGEYALFDRARLYARHEFISSLSGVYGLNPVQQQRATVIGLDSSYMKDGQVFSEYRMRDALAGRDAEAAMGLRNFWTVSEGVRVSTGLERLHTLAGVSRESTAVTAAIEYTRNPLWKASGRLEVRRDNVADTWLNTVSIARKLDNEWTVLARNIFSLSDNKTTGNKSQDRFQIGFAYRDSATNKTNALTRYEFKRERDNSAADSISKRDVHIVSAHADYLVSRPWIIEAHYAGKWLDERYTGTGSKYAAHLLGARSTYDVTEKWDVGLIGNTLLSQVGKSRQYGVGLETGYRVKSNLWLSLGFNFSGFSDKDLVDTDYTNKGVFVRLRFKFDEKIFSGSSE